MIGVFPCVEMSFSIVMHSREWLQAVSRHGSIWILILVAAKLSGGNDPAAQHLGRGYELIQDNRYRDAESEFRQALASNPNLTRARYQLAICLFALGERNESEQEFARVSREAPDNRGAVYYLGRLRLLEGDPEGAISYLKPLTANPPMPDTLFYAGCAWLNKGDLPMAIDALERAAAASPRDYRIPYRLGRAYARAGRQQDAAREYEHASALREEYNNAAHDSLQCTAELDSRTEQSACRNMYDASDPDKLTMLGILYGRHGAYSEAIAPLLAASKLDPDSFEIFHNLGLSYFRLRRYEEARPALERAVSLRPDFFGSNALLGAVLFALKDDRAAWVVLAHAHELEPANAQVNDLLYKVSLALARTRFEANDYNQCLLYLQKAADMKPSDGEVHRKMSDIYHLLGNSILSAQELQRAETLRNGDN
jgi:tetratricopeptide (TPR) repeat protein